MPRLACTTVITLRPVRTAFTRLSSPVLVLLVATFSRSASAYRPFDGTDADVAEEGTFEIEAGPGYLHQAAYDALVLPTVVLNLGVQNDTELVLQTNRLHLLGALSPGQPREQYLDTGFFTKHVWRDGALQGAIGPSVATEIGPLFPTGPGPRKLGASAGTIMSVVTPVATFHFNVVPELTVEHHADLFVSAIAEGPQEWTVRPVTEVYLDHDFTVSTTYSWLLGVIWRAREGLELDAGARVADADGSLVIEGRVGVTWAFQVWADRTAQVEGPGRGAPGRLLR